MRTGCSRTCSPGGVPGSSNSARSGPSSNGPPRRWPTSGCGTTKRIGKGRSRGGDSAAIGTAVEHDFPFRRWGWGLEHVLDYLTNVARVRVPVRTDCARCPYQRLGEWYNLWLNYREVFLSAEADEERFGHTYRTSTRDSWPAALKDLRALFEAGTIPERSLKMMERRDMCRACTL
jgi:hypothetical protein